MKTAITVTTVAAFALLGAGCTQLRSAAPSTPEDYWIKSGQTRASGKAVSLLYYADYVRNLGSADYAQEVEHVRQLYSKEKTDFRLLQYVLALSVPGGDFRKVQQPLDALNDHKIADPELAALAQLVNADMAERRRLEIGSRRAEAGAKRADELEKKMEALKNIEKNLIQRDQRTPGGIGGNAGGEEK